MSERKQRSSSRYIGVYWHKAQSPWSVQLTDPQTKRLRHIGRYASNSHSASHSTTHPRKFVSNAAVPIIQPILQVTELLRLHGCMSMMHTHTHMDTHTQSLSCWCAR
jgi:hypothetical protein